MEKKYFSDNESITWLSRNGSSIAEIANSFTEAFFMINNTKIIYINDKAKRLFDIKYTIDNNFQLSLKDITSNAYQYESYFDFLREKKDFNETTNNIRFKWPHMTLTGRSFDCEVILFLLEHSPDRQYWGCILCDLTKWQAERNSLENHFNQLFHLLNNANEVTLIINPKDGSIYSANAQALAFYEYNLDEMKQLKIDDINILSSTKIQMEMDKATKEERQHFFFKHRTKSGEVYDVKVLSGPITMKGVSYLYSIITPLKKVKSAPQYDLDYHQLFRETPYPTILMNESLEIIAHNHSFENEFGYNDTEIKQKNIGTLIVPAEYIEETNFFIKRIKNGEHFTQTVLREHKDGRALHYALSAKGLKCTDDSDCLILATYIPNEQQVSIDYEHKLFERVYENIHEGVIVTDSKFNTLWTNQAYLQVIGQRQQDVIGKRPPFKTPRDTKEDTLWQHIEEVGKWTGEILIEGKDHNHIGWLTFMEHRDTQNIITNYIGMFYDITDFRANENRIKQLAFYDSLTNLLSRGHFFDSLQQKLIDAKKAFTLYYIDLNEFKSINDHYGHLVGDLVLKQFAVFLQDTFNQSIYLSRIGGDEFVAITYELSGAQIEAQIQHAFDTLKEPFDIEGVKIPVSCAIGYARFPMDGNNLDELLSSADHKMYEMKKNSKQSTH